MGIFFPIQMVVFELISIVIGVTLMDLEGIGRTEPQVN